MYRLVSILLFFVLPLAHTSLLSDQFTAIKKALVLFLGAISAIIFATNRKVWLPEFNKLTLWALISFILVRTLSVTLNFSWISTLSLFETVTFLAFIMYFSNQFNHDRELNLRLNLMPILAALSIVLTYSIYQIYICRFVNNIYSNECFSSTIGSSNMLAEYIVLAVPFIMHAWKSYSGPRHFLIGVNIAISIFLIWFSQSRSALIGIGLTVILYLIFEQKRKREHLYLGLSALLIFSAAKWIPLSSMALPTHETNIFLVDKKASTADRISLLRGSLSFLADSPWGVGPGQFEFGYLPFQKFSGVLINPLDPYVFLDPHNEFLKWGIESGWLFLGLIFVVLFLLLRELKGNVVDKKYRFLIASLSIVVFLQCLFQFPFELGPSYIWICYFLGLLFSFFKSASFEFKNSVRVLFYSMAMMIAIWSTCFLASNYLELNHSTNLEMSKLACSIDPSSWRACGNKIELELNSGDFESALIDIKRELALRPFNFVALKYLMIYLVEKNSVNSACQVGTVLDSFFSPGSDFRQFLEENCQKMSDPFSNQSTASSFKKEYLIWLKKVLD